MIDRTKYEGLLTEVKELRTKYFEVQAKNMALSRSLKDLRKRYRVLATKEKAK